MKLGAYLNHYSVLIVSKKMFKKATSKSQVQ